MAAGQRRGPLSRPRGDAVPGWTRGGGRGAGELQRRDALPAAAGGAGAVQERAGDRLRGASIFQRGARDDERGAPVHQRRAGDDERGAPVHQRRAGDDERGAPIDQRRAGDDQHRAAAAQRRAQPTPTPSWAPSYPARIRRGGGGSPTFRSWPGTIGRRTCGASARTRWSGATCSTWTSDSPSTSCASPSARCSRRGRPRCGRSWTPRADEASASVRGTRHSAPRVD